MTGPPLRAHAHLLLALLVAARVGAQDAPPAEPAPAPPPAARPATQPTAAPTHEATDFRLTVTRGGKDLFSLHARRSASFDATRTELDEVVLYAGAGPVSGLEVRGRRGTYNPTSGDFVLSGGVTIGRPGDLEARVEKMTYAASEGLAHSADPVSLRGPRLEGSAVGIEVHPAQGRMGLLAQVAIRYSETGRSPRRIDLTCGRLDYILSPPRAECRGGARATSGDRRLEAAALDLDLREADRRPLAGRAEGQARVSLTLAPPPPGEAGPALRGFPSGSVLDLAGERIDLEFDPELGDVRTLTAGLGGALEARPLDGSDSSRELTAGWMRLGLRKERRGGRSLPETLEARGEARLVWSDPGPGGERRQGSLRAGTLAARWTSDAAAIDSARLGGGWRLERPDLRAAGSEAEVDARVAELRGGADGHAVLEREGRLLAGEHLRVPRGEGAWRGEGGVQVRRGAAAGGSGWSPLGGEGEFWVSAERFEVDPRSWAWTFEERVRAWQGSSLIESDRLSLDETARALAARGHVVTRAAGAPPGPGGGEGSDVVWVRAPSLDYREEERRAEYRDGVEMIHDTSHLAAREVDVWLARGDGRVERVEARGDVRVAYQDALAEAERAEYAPAGRRLRLWTPGGAARARRRDGSQALSGTELTFEGSSERIAVRSGKRGRSWVVFHDGP